MDMVYAGNGSGIYHCLNENDVRRIMAHPQVMHASDGSTIQLNHAQPHPRNYGTFPRVLGLYVRKHNVISLVEAIRKMTSLPASILGLSNRGKIKKEYVADLVIFNPETIMDKATWDKPHQYPSGISWVLVNGKIAINNGKYTDSLPGKILKHSL
jgi:dihydroorotase/N-acyl-D-amino-acid deacylase